MANKSQARLHQELTTRYGRKVADAFFAAIDDIRSAVEVQRLTAAIEAGDIGQAIEALHLEPEAFDAMQDAIREAHTEGGRATAEAMPKRNPDGTALVVRFDGRNREAEAWLSSHSSQLITRITEEQRQNVREALTEGMSRGRNPRQTALDIVGRVSRVTGKRVGGTLGLSRPQAEYVQSARDELASADPAAMRNYLERKARDKRFDRSVLKAIREERAVDPAIAAKAVTAYEGRLLRQRGELIGMNETFSALAHAKEQAYLQAVSSGKVSAAAVTKIWRHLGNLNPRHQHLAMNGRETNLLGVFVLPDGTAMRYPHDPSAPVSHTAGCHCQADYKVDFFANLR